ncbi:tryptophan--tRNA ligase, cytoplasmic-like [Lolium rigidum]|uniref:tryptophan--tRNA ligase, cytoplasmic-like n=1 Tax=Lolium rigidum TaxID=89674 RepID=UPI001F5CEAB7|nr:tryptophan--tRNA ligase, cytoplasmic-like [Lolium rigidum]
MRVKLLFLLWRTWHHRNNAVHGDGKASIAASVPFLQSYVDSLQPGTSAPDPKGKSAIVVNRPAPVMATEVPSKWLAPGPGWIKVNVDAGWNSPNVPGGAGLVVRNDTGRVLFSAWKTLPLCASAEEAEILALLEGIRYLAANPQFSGILETDCARIVAVLSSLDRDRSSNWSLFMEARAMLALLPEVKIYIFSNFDPDTRDFKEIKSKISKCVTHNKVRDCFGFSPEDNIGKIGFPAVQAVPSFSSSFPRLFPHNHPLRCLIPCAIDQDPYFRMARDAAARIGYHKPSLIESRFFPALQGENTKMSASDSNSAIYVTDIHEEIKNKVNKYAFSGGQDSKELHRKLGANLEVDVPIKYLNFFLEDDDDLEGIKKEYKEGRMLTKEVKDRLVDVLYDIVSRHQRVRAQVTEEMVDAFMAPRPLPNMFG